MGEEREAKREKGGECRIWEEFMWGFREGKGEVEGRRLKFSGDGFEGNGEWFSKADKGSGGEDGGV